MLMDSYINHFGFQKKVREYNKKRAKLAKLKLDYIKNDKRFLVNKITVLENDIENIKKLIFSQNTNEFHENNVILQKWYGQRIDLKNTTVVEYFSILKSYEQANKAHRNSRRRGTG